MLSASQLKLFSKLVKGEKEFLISGHQSPDGDVIGSTLAMALGLKKLGKKAIAFNQDGCPPSLRFLPKTELITTEIPKNFKGVLITVDSGNVQRLGPVLQEYPFKEVWNIDHHKSNTRFGKYNFIDLKAGSSGQVVLDLLDACRGFKLTKEIASNIFCTLSTDTGSFKYSNATAEVFKMAARLIEAGAKPQAVSLAIYDTYSSKKLALMTKVLESMRFSHDGKLAEIFMTKDDVSSTGARNDEAEDFVNLPRGVEGVKVACFYRETAPGEWKLSLRGRGDVDVLQLATPFQGGGHKAAAGCTIYGTREEVVAKLNDVLNQTNLMN